MTSTSVNDGQGLYFEDLSVGDVLNCESTREITRGDLEAFAHLSGDRNPIHLDTQSAQAAGLPDVIAQGALCFAIATGLAWGMGIVKGTVMFTETQTTFLRPVHPGDSLSLKLKVLSVRKPDSSDKGEVCFSTTLSNQNGKTVQRGRWTARVSTRPA